MMKRSTAFIIIVAIALATRLVLPEALEGSVVSAIHGVGGSSSKRTKSVDLCADGGTSYLRK